MATATGTVNGWRQRVSKTWYPTAGGWTACSSTPGVNLVVSCPTTTSGTASNNMYGTIIKITTPNTSGASTFSKIAITISATDSNSTTGYLYGALRTVDDSTSTTSDTTATFKTNLAGGSSVASISPSYGSYSTYTLSFSGSFAKNTSYYLWLFTESTNDIYNLQASSTAYTCTCTYTLATYTISYNANGHGTAPSSQTKTYGTALTLRSFISDVTGTGYTVSYNANGGSSTPSSSTSTLTYTQTYWNTNSSGTGTNYSSGGSYTNNGAATLYAIWSTTKGSVTLASAISRTSSTSSYTITYNANGGSSTPSSQTLTRTTPYTFSKWAAGSTSGTQYSAGASYTPSAATTMYAIWTTGTTTGSITLASGISKANTTETGYTVTLEANGGTLDSTTLTTINTRSYTFNKWNTASNGSGTDYSAGASYSTASDLSLYATFTSSISAVSSVSLPTPKKSGYKFLGWSTTNGGTTYVDQNYVPSGNTTLYANYKEGYDIEMYIYNGGRWMNVLMNDA